MKPSFPSVRLAFISHRTPACLLTFNDIAACIPAVVVGLGATFMPLRTLCSNFRHLFTIRYCHYMIVSIHFNALQIAPRECVLPCTLGKMPGKVAFAPSPSMNHVCSSYSPHKKHSSTRPYLLWVFSFRSDIVQRGRVPKPDCVLLNESVHLKFIPDGFARYFNTYGRLTRRCESRSAAVVRHNSRKHYYFYFTHNKLSKRHPLLPDRFIHLCPIFLLSIVACYLPFRSMRAKLAFLHQHLFIFARMCAKISPQFVSIFAGHTFRSRDSELKFYHYALLFYSCRQHPPLFYIGQS